MGNILKHKLNYIWSIQKFKELIKIKKTSIGDFFFFFFWQYAITLRPSKKQYFLLSEMRSLRLDRFTSGGLVDRQVAADLIGVGKRLVRNVESQVSCSLVHQKQHVNNNFKRTTENVKHPVVENPVDKGNTGITATVERQNKR